VTTRLMYDSVNLKGIPNTIANNSIIAFYLDGEYAVPSISYVETLFPPSRFRYNPIDVTASRADYARTLDVETGDAVPAQTEQWLREFAATNPAYPGGGRGVLYSDVSSLPAIRTGTGPYILGRDYYIWPATGDGSVVTPELLRAKYPQYAWPDGCVVACQNIWARTYDSSVVFDAGFLP
jgi:hypothetical protein